MKTFESDDRRTGSRATLAGILAAVVAGSLLFVEPRPADAAWDGTQAVRLGDQMRAEFRGTPLSEEHRYTFYAMRDTVLTARIVADAESAGLVPEVTLLTQNGDVVDLGTSRVGNLIRGFRFTASGNYVLRVRAVSGTGGYALNTKARFPKVLAGATTTGTYRFDAAEGTVLAARVRATRGSTATPTITGLTYQGGEVDLGTQDNTAKLSRIVLPIDAGYTLAIDPGTAGQSVDVRVSLGVPVRGRGWSFGWVEDTAGLATENREKWLRSAHADHSAAAFNNWNATNPPAVPTSCAKCHSTPGYIDFLGGDGSAVGVVNQPAPIGSVVECDACHSQAAIELTSVTFPSGKTITGLGREARCMVCHQGRESTVSVEAKITAANVPDADTVSAQINFTNIHYFAAGASLYGREVDGGYEYKDTASTSTYVDPVTGLSVRKPYDRKFAHVASKDTCIECHDPHSQEVRIEDCAACHVNAAGNPVATIEDLHEVRMNGTTADFDGDGSLEGTHHELKGLQSKLFQAIQLYAETVIGTKIGYDSHAYPYFFRDTDGDGAISAAEAVRSNGYPSWNARLLRACYNFQFAEKDPGAFAHNAKYVIALLYDSIADIHSRIAVPGFENLVRNDFGHFDTAAQAYRNWDVDADNLVNETCARCHTPDGFLFRVTYGVDPTLPQALSSGMVCESCHETGANFKPGGDAARRYVPKVSFPYPSTASSTQIAALTLTNGAKGTIAEDDSFLCLTCHIGRESKATMDAAIALTPTATNFGLRNVHYMPAGAIQYGSKAAVGYQYDGKTYATRWDHMNGYAVNTALPMEVPGRCAYCHVQEGHHTFEPEVGTECQGCHFEATNGVNSFRKTRPTDYDGDGNATEPLKDEVATYGDRLYAAIQAYATNVRAKPIVYFADAHPYFFNDKNSNGQYDAATESGSANQYKSMDAKLLRACFNYQVWQKEHGAWAHNTNYILQLLYDSIEDLGGNVAGLVRP